MSYRRFNTKQRVGLALLSLIDLYALANALWIALGAGNDSGMALLAFLFVPASCVIGAALLNLWLG